MPIVGLTGRGPRLPEIGKLFKGAKKEKKTNSAGREYETFGKELDHWRFESNERHIVEAFNAAFIDGKDEPPRVIPVYLPFSRTEENFEAWQEAYTAGGLSHRCDGNQCVLWFDEKSQTYQTSPKECPTLSMPVDKAKREGCKPVARLRVIIPALNQLGFVTVETHSKNDILHLDSALPAYESLQPKGLQGIPMLLCRVQKEISTPGDGKRARRTKWLIVVKPHPEWASLYLDNQRQAALASVSESRLLTANLSEEEEEEEIAGEVEMLDDWAERGEILGEMGDIWLAQGRARSEWPAYLNKELAPKTTDQLGEMLLKWRGLPIPAAKAKAAVKAATTEPAQEAETVSV